MLAVEVGRLARESDSEPEVVLAAADRQAPFLLDERIGDVGAEAPGDLVNLLVPRLEHGGDWLPPAEQAAAENDLVDSTAHGRVDRRHLLELFPRSRVAGADEDLGRHAPPEFIARRTRFHHFSLP